MFKHVSIRAIATYCSISSARLCAKRELTITPLSLSPSHSRIVSKRLNALSNGFHV